MINENNLVTLLITIKTCYNKWENRTRRECLVQLKHVGINMNN